MNARFEGHFVDADGGPGERGSGLVGTGVIEISPRGLVISATQRQATLSAVIATIVALVATLAFVVAVVLVLDALALDVGLRLPAVLGIVVLAASWAGTDALLTRVLPLATVQKTLGWSFVTAIRVHHARAELLTTSPDLAGLSAFVTERPQEVLAACAAARASAG